MTEYLSEALFKYANSTSDREAGEVRTAIIKHVLGKLLESPELRELQNRDPKQVMDQVPTAGFVVLANPIFEKALIELTADLSPLDKTKNTLRVRKSKWKRFCNWLQRQDWYVPVPVRKEIAEANTKNTTHIARGTLKEVKKLKNIREGKSKQFRLLEPAWTSKLRKEFQDFDRFCGTVSEWRTKSVRAITLAAYHKGIERILGFQKQQGVPLKDLSLHLLLKQSVLKDYEKWSRGKGLSSYTIRNDIRVAKYIAQWAFSQSYPDQDWRNPEPVKTVRSYVKAVVDRKDRPHASQEAFEEREISMDQCWEILKYLAWRCKDLEKQHGVTKEVADAWQDYLLLAFLITTGGRQREARELAFSKIFVEANGEVLVDLPPEGHKTGSKTNKGRQYPLFVGPMQEELIADLFYYRDHIRPQNLTHDYVFFIRLGNTRGNKITRRGDPIGETTYLSHLVSRTVAVITAHLYGVENARWTAPHDFRRIIASWVCTYGDPEHLAIYAELLGHDLKELMTRYNKMHPGRLARQAPIAYQAIAAKEAQFKLWQTRKSRLDFLTVAEMGSDGLIKVLKKLVRKLWNALTSRRRDLLSAHLTPMEREILED